MFKLRLLPVIVLVTVTSVRAAGPTIVADVRAAIGRGDLAAAEALVKKFRTEVGNTPEALEALSWLGRGALAAEDYAKAARYAEQTEALALDAQGRALTLSRIFQPLAPRLRRKLRRWWRLGARQCDSPSQDQLTRYRCLDSGSPPEEHSSAQPRRQAGSSVHCDGVPRADAKHEGPRHAPLLLGALVSRLQG
jgi:hypothetical protein